MRPYRDPAALPVLISSNDIHNRVAELGLQISDDGADGESGILLMGILSGAFVFLADLARAISLPVEVDFVSAFSYGDSTESAGEVTLEQRFASDIVGRDVLVVDGIVDTGSTLCAVLGALKKGQPKSLKSCTLLDKPARRAVALRVNYVGFEIPDEFVVGYGLDYDQQYRHLSDIHMLDPS